MLKGILQNALTIEQREAGLSLEEVEDFLYLFDREGKRQAVFSSKGATVKAIRDTADKVKVTEV